MGFLRTIGRKTAFSEGAYAPGGTAFGAPMGSGRRMIALLLVAALHAGAIYALASGMATRTVDAVRRNLVEAKIVADIPEEKTPEEADPHRLPPPPAMDVVPPPSFAPPPFIPLPEVRIKRPPAENAIKGVSTEKPPEAIGVYHVPVSAAARTPITARQAAVVRTAPRIDAGRACPKPEYPSSARRNEETGTVLLHFLVDLDGKVVESRVEKTSGYPTLDEAARRALSRCRFTPGTLNGKPEKAWARIQYVWKLE